MKDFKQFVDSDLVAFILGAVIIFGSFIATPSEVRSIGILGVGFVLWVTFAGFRWFLK